MCKPKNLGGKRCSSHLTSQKVAVEAQIQEKVLASLPSEVQERLQQEVREFEDSTNSKNPKSQQEKIDGVAIHQKMLNDSSYSKAHAEFQSYRKEYEHYTKVMDNMKNPSAQDKKDYVALTNPKYARNAEKISALNEKYFDGEATDEEVAKLNKLQKSQEKMLSEAPASLSQQESDEMKLKNPHMSKMTKSALSAKKVKDELAPHYRKEMVLTRSTAYNEALQKFNKTNEGHKLSNKLAELTATQQSDDANMEKLNQRIDRAKDAQNDVTRDKLAVEWLQRNEFNLATEYSNKFDYVKSNISKNNLDTKKPIELPRFVRFDGKPAHFTITPQSEYENTVNRLMKMNKIDPAKASPETVAKAKSRVFTRWGITSMQEIASNPEVKEELEQNGRLFRSNRNHVIEQEREQIKRRQARDLAKSKSVTIQERFGIRSELRDK